MFNVLSRRLQHCNKVAVNINNAAPTQLQQIKTQLAEEMGKPVGLHTMGIPAAVSTLGVIVSFAIPQLWLGYGILTALDQPAERVFVWVVLVALLFAGLNGVTMFMIGKGSMRAVRLHFTLTVISLLLTAAYLIRFRLRLTYGNPASRETIFHRPGRTADSSGSALLHPRDGTPGTVK